MKKVFSLAIFAAFLSAPALAVECEQPVAPDVPDGASAAEAAMRQAAGNVKRYMAETEEYLACLQFQEENMGARLTPVAEKQFVDRHNAAVDAMEEVAERFNEALRAFKSANS